jgi:hypothetical protein
MSQGSNPISAWTVEEVRAAGEEVRTQLIIGYVAVMILVAGSDGTVDADETNALMGWVHRRTESGEGPAFALLKDEPKQVIAAYNAVGEGTLEPAQALTHTLDVLNRDVEASLRAAYVEELRALGREIAGASGGSSIFFWKSKVSKEEEKLLAELDRLLAKTVVPD